LLALCYKALQVYPVLDYPGKHFICKPGNLFAVFPDFVARVFRGDFYPRDLGTVFFQMREGSFA
jgi:hypothetical protein